MRINKKNICIYIGLFIIVFALALSSTYNPFNLRRMHVDSSVYITIAKGITRGQLPYRDFVDNKGPLTYIISVPGLLLGGFTGVWITEIVLLFVSVLFAYKIALFFGNHFQAFLGTLFSFVLLIVFFYVNAGTEEYSFPFLMISLYIFTKYYFSEKHEVTVFELIVLGSCFASAVLIKPNMFPLWAGFCFVILLENLFKQRYFLLLKYFLFFCTGIFVIFIPVFFYLQTNGIFLLFINQVILGGAAKGFNIKNFNEIVKNYFIIINRNYSFLPLFFGVFCLLKYYKQSLFIFYAGYVFSYFLMVLFLSFTTGDSHCNMVLIPFFIPVLSYLINFLYSSFYSIKRKEILLVLFLCFIFSERLIRYFNSFSYIFFDISGANLIKAGKTIDENTLPEDKIISLGFNGYIYPFTQRQTASKYFYQGSGLDYVISSIKPSDGFIADILTAKPKIIAIFIAEGRIGQIIENWHTPILELIKTEYRLLSDANGFLFYIRDID